MGYLLKLVITLIVMVATCVAAWYVPSWAWTFGWVGASLCSIFVPSSWSSKDESTPALGAAMPGIHHGMSSPTRPAPPMPECKPPRVEQAERIQVLHLAAGGTLILSSDDHLSTEQRAEIRAYALAFIPEGCKVMVLDGGLKVAGTISARDVNAESIARLDAHNLT